MPTYPHICKKCDNEWEEFYGMNDNPPTVCPKCQTEGMVVRLIAGCSGRGIVKLTGHELKAKLQEDAQNIKREAYRNEKVLANIVGEERYHHNELDRKKRYG